MKLSVSKESPSVLSDIRMMNHAVLQAIPYKAKFVLSLQEYPLTVPDRQFPFPESHTPFVLIAS